MAVYKTSRFEVRADAREQAERAMHEFAAYVRRELAESMWTVYRDPDLPTRYVAFLRAEHAAAEQRHRDAPGTQAFVAALQPLLVGAFEEAGCELVTSSDLAPRRKPERRR